MYAASPRVIRPHKQTPPDEYRIGDIVVPRGGGPEMRVIRIDTARGVFTVEWGGADGYEIAEARENGIWFLRRPAPN